MFCVNYLNIIFLIISSVLCVLSYIMNRKGVSPLKDRPYRILLVLAVGLALFVRIAEFGSVPFGVNQDEAMAAVDAKALAMHGTDRNGMVYPVHFEAWGFGQMSVLMSYMMIPFIRLFGFSTAVVRLPTLIVSLAGILALYFFCRESFNRDLALIVLFFAAVNPWHIVQSRWALDCNIFPHMLIIAASLLSHGLTNQRHRFCIYISMIFFGLSMYCYGISIYTVTVFLVAVCIWLILTRKIRIYDVLICLAIYLAVSWPFIAVMIINTFRLPSIETAWFTIPYFSGTVRTSDILFFSDNFFPQLWSNIVSLLLILFQAGNDYLGNVVPGFSTMYPFTLPFSILGFIWIFKNRRTSPGAMLIFILFLTGIFDGLITNNVNVNRINLIFYPVIVFSGIGIYRVIRNVKFGDLAIEIMFAAAFTLLCCTYFTSYAKDISLNFSSDFGQAVSELKMSDSDKIFITPDVQDKGRWYVSEILSLYYLEVDASEYQSSSFGSRYHFINPTEDIVKSNKDASYVITAEDSKLFDGDDFEIIKYGRYAAVIPSEKD